MGILAATREVSQGAVAYPSASQNLEGGKDKFYLGDSMFGYIGGFKKSSWK